MTPAEEQTSVERLIVVVGELRSHLNRRFVLIILISVLATVALINNWMSTRDNQRIANAAYVQALTNNRDNMIARRQFVETRDCPIIYLRELLQKVQKREDLLTVEPPCDTEDLGMLDRSIAELDKRIAEARK